jgi:hypothetical protein
MQSYTEMAGGITDAADGVAEAKAEPAKEDAASGATDGPASTRVVPKKGAVVVLYEERHFKGKSITLECCGSEDLKPHGLRRIRSAKVPPGFKLNMQTSSYQSKETTSVELWGNALELDRDFVRSYTSDCCKSAYLDGSGVTHSVVRSVYLFPEPDYQGVPTPFLPGDHDPPKGLVVRSVLVPAGSRVSLYASSLKTDGGFIDLLLQDCSKFPRDNEHVPKVFGVKVRHMVEGDDLHGAFVFFHSNLAGRSQFFQSGDTHTNPEDFKGIASVRMTKSSEAAFRPRRIR